MITQSLSSALAPWNPISANVCGFLPPAAVVVGLGVFIGSAPVGKLVGAESTSEIPCTLFLLPPAVFPMGAGSSRFNRILSSLLLPLPGPGLGFRPPTGRPGLGEFEGPGDSVRRPGLEIRGGEEDKVVGLDDEGGGALDPSQSYRLLCRCGLDSRSAGIFPGTGDPAAGVYPDAIEFLRITSTTIRPSCLFLPARPRPGAVGGPPTFELSISWISWIDGNVVPSHGGLTGWVSERIAACVRRRTSLASVIVSCSCRESDWGLDCVSAARRAEASAFPCELAYWRVRRFEIQRERGELTNLYQYTALPTSLGCPTPTSA